MSAAGSREMVAIARFWPRLLLNMLSELGLKIISQVLKGDLLIMLWEMFIMLLN